jgi:hypothetical protein
MKWNVNCSYSSQSTALSETFRTYDTFTKFTTHFFHDLPGVELLLVSTCYGGTCPAGNENLRPFCPVANLPQYFYHLVLSLRESLLHTESQACLQAWANQRPSDDGQQGLKNDAGAFMSVHRVLTSCPPLAVSPSVHCTQHFQESGRPMPTAHILSSQLQNVW